MATIETGLNAPNTKAPTPDNSSLARNEKAEQDRQQKEDSIRRSLALKNFINDLPVEGMSPMDVDVDSYIFESPTTFRESSFLANRFDIPDWGIKDYMNERGSWHKQLESLLGEPTWFYFKVFFKFDTYFGLFGGILNMNPDKDVHTNSSNSALRYLNNIKQRYKQEKIPERAMSLIKFTQSLAYISCNAPWAFASVKDLDTSLKYDLRKAPEQKSISLELLQEAVDMRLSSLFDLYRFAAFDFAHDKEIIPENLRKFDMDIVLFQVPIKYFQTSMKDMKNRAVPYKNLNDQVDFTNRMSFHLFTLQNCEFDISSFASLIPGSMANEKPFEMKPTIKINYDKCYHHSLNEWIHVLVGDSSFYQFASEKGEGHLGKDTNFKDFLAFSRGDKSLEDLGITKKDSSEYTRVNILKYGVDNALYGNMGSSNYKAVVEASEDMLGNAMRVVDSSVALGNLYKSSKWSDLYKAPLNSITNTWGNIKNSFTQPYRTLFPSNSTTKDYNGYGATRINNYYK